ncbi:unnamed protein product [Amoebophrya sp. A120]|nr:unnamed protein product [Amoebophrya sp. A120]|eukprot:GSA120T00017387001.1
MSAVKSGATQVDRDFLQCFLFRNSIPCGFDFHSYKYCLIFWVLKILSFSLLHTALPPLARIVINMIFQKEMQVEIRIRISRPLTSNAISIIAASPSVQETCVKRGRRALI